MEPGATTVNLPGAIAVGDYLLSSKLGEGPFSTVWKAVHRASGEVVAVKQVHLSKLNRHLRSCLDCELNFLSAVDHPNIIRLLHVFQVDCLGLCVDAQLLLTRGSSSYGRSCVISIALSWLVL